MNSFAAGRDEPPTELELEEERAGYASSQNQPNDEFGATMSVAGDDPYRRAPNEESPAADAGSEPSDDDPTVHD